jgi:hypothetical protein
MKEDFNDDYKPLKAWQDYGIEHKADLMQEFCEIHWEEYEKFVKRMYEEK